MKKFRENVASERPRAYARCTTGSQYQDGFIVKGERWLNAYKGPKT